MTLKKLPKACLLIASTAALLSADSAPTDTIFMGMKLHVVIEGEKYPLVGYSGGVHYYEKAGEIFAVPPPVNIFSQKTIRHSSASARVIDLRTRPYSSEAAAKLKEYADAASRQMQQEDLRQSSISAALGGLSLQATGAAGAIEGLEAVIDLQEASISESSTELQSNLNSIGNVMQNLEADLVDAEVSGRFDALIIAMDLEISEALVDGYLFARCRYFDNAGSNPGKKYTKVKLVEVGDVPANRRKKVVFHIGGFPPGPQITEISYHLFSRDREIPTDYSEQRIEVSEDEAYDFLYADLFVSDAPDDTEPKLFKPLPSEWAEDLKARALLRQPVITVQVLADGSIGDISVSECPETAAGEIQSMIARCRFLPAMEDGIPVDREISMPLRLFF